MFYFTDGLRRKSEHFLIALFLVCQSSGFSARNNKVQSRKTRSSALFEKNASLHLYFEMFFLNLGWIFFYLSEFIKVIMYNTKYMMMHMVDGPYFWVQVLG